MAELNCPKQHRAIVVNLLEQNLDILEQNLDILAKKTLIWRMKIETGNWELGTIPQLNLDHIAFKYSQNNWQGNRWNAWNKHDWKVK